MAEDDDWLAGTTIEARAENLEIPGMSIPLEIEIPDDDTPVA